ncbi:MAG TPA: hypothetical protein VIG44_12155, partial [Thermomicrobiales bacterium]
TAPMIVLLFGVPAGVALARRTPLSEPIPIIPRAGTAVANGTARPGGQPPFIGPQRFIGPPIPISQAQSGVIGVINRATPGRFVVYTRAKKLAIIAVDAKTTIRMNGKNIKAADVKRGDRVTVLGHRDSGGAFHADLIRVTRPARPDPPPGQAR